MLLSNIRATVLALSAAFVPLSSFSYDSTFDLGSLSAPSGITINGTIEREYSGASVSFVGDINGDGVDDLFIGRRPNNATTRTLGGYIVFGNSQASTPLPQLDALNGSNGFSITNEELPSVFHRPVQFDPTASAAGDVNGDGIDDVILGASNGNAPSQAYVIFGSKSGFAATIDVSTLNGTNGFIVENSSGERHLGPSVSGAGDINNDGIDDILVGSPDDFSSIREDGNGRGRTGTALLLFGKNTGFDARIDVSKITKRDGLKFSGTQKDGRTGASVNSAGDVNGDGINDVIIGTVTRKTRIYDVTGGAHVIYGGSDLFANPFVNPDNIHVDLGKLDGSNGFSIQGINQDDLAGSAVSSPGDFNGDGVDDLLIAAPKTRLSGVGQVGAVYLIYGQRNRQESSLNLADLDGNNGFRMDGTIWTLNGVQGGSVAGQSISGAGDLNSDGYSDIMIYGANADIGDGVVFVVFGTPNKPASPFALGSLNGENGFVMQGARRGGASYGDITGGSDFNADGVSDLIIGNPGASPNQIDEAGETYVFFGQPQEAVVIEGDANGDGHVDILDVRAIRAARNTDATGSNDPRDINGDGRITIRDMRLLARMCDLPRCARR